MPHFNLSTESFLKKMSELREFYPTYSVRPGLGTLHKLCDAFRGLRVGAGCHLGLNKGRAGKECGWEMGQRHMSYDNVSKWCCLRYKNDRH